MSIIMCSKGHYFDNCKFFQCPYCGVALDFMQHGFVGNTDKIAFDQSDEEDEDKTILLEIGEDDDKTVLLSDHEDSDNKTALLFGDEEDDDKTILLSEMENDNGVMP